MPRGYRKDGTKLTPPKAVQFQPGQSGNPAGRPKTPEDILLARRLRPIELERILNEMLYATEGQIDAKLQDPELPFIERMVISIMKQAVSEGDPTRLNFLLDRLIGKVREPTQEHTLNLRMLPREKVIELGLKAVRQLEGKTEDKP